MIRCLQSGTVFNSLFPLDHRNIPHCTGEACFAHHVSSFLHRISVLNPGAKANYPSSGRPGRPWVAKQTIIFFELFVEPAMRFAVQRGGVWLSLVVAFLRNGVWLSHSYEKKKKNGQICAATVKKEKIKWFSFSKNVKKIILLSTRSPSNLIGSCVNKM